MPPMTSVLTVVEFSRSLKYRSRIADASGVLAQHASLRSEVAQGAGGAIDSEHHLRVATGLGAHVRDDEPGAFAAFVEVAVRLGGCEPELLRVELSRPRRIRHGQRREYRPTLQHGALPRYRRSLRRRCMAEVG